MAGVLAGKVALVTGATSGIGVPTGVGLARLGARVVVTYRDARRGRNTAELIRRRVPGAAVEAVALDLADLASVRATAADLTGRLPALDVLVNNAGIAMAPRRTTADGFESQLGTNHLGHFALTGLLLPLLLAAPGARVVTVTSDNHAEASIDFDDLHAERSYSRTGQYARSKLANLLFALELHRRVEAAGVPLLSLAADPGLTATNIGALPRAASLLMRLFLKPAAKGAVPSLHCAAGTGVRGGELYGPGPRLTPPAATARDEAVAARLWEVSEDLTGVRFTPLAQGAH